MAARKYDLQILRGKLFDTRFTDKIDGTPVDYTGYTAKLRIYNAANANLLTLTNTLDGSGNGIILGGDEGTIRVVIKTAKTATLTTFTRAKYQLQLTRPDDEDVLFLEGNVQVHKEDIDP
jgi:hypothetical protein